MSVAGLYPARTDTNGRTWYRPVRDPGIGVDQWGWTSDPAQAHPDYDALNMCTCFVTDPSTWFYYGSAVEPGSQMEPNPLCPVHPATFGDLFALAAAEDRAEGDRLLAELVPPSESWPGPAVRTAAGVASAVAAAEQAGLW